MNGLITSFGLEQQRNILIGTPVRKGISGGQKRRVSVASQLITAPKVLFLDEPTSGLDSTASFEVIQFLKKYAQEHQVLCIPLHAIRQSADPKQLIVIASIHQPSTKTFQLFDTLLLLSQGRTCYYGPVSKVKTYFDGLRLYMPPMTNPAEFLLELTNVDFSEDKTAATEVLAKIQDLWDAHGSNTPVVNGPTGGEKRDQVDALTIESQSITDRLAIPVTLLHRLIIKSVRDVFAYWIRIIMYMGKPCVGTLYQIESAADNPSQVSQS